MRSAKITQCRTLDETKKMNESTWVTVLRAYIHKYTHNFSTRFDVFPFHLRRVIFVVFFFILLLLMLSLVFGCMKRSPELLLIHFRFQHFFRRFCYFFCIVLPISFDSVFFFFLYILPLSVIFFFHDACQFNIYLAAL